MSSSSSHTILVFRVVALKKGLYGQREFILSSGLRCSDCGGGSPAIGPTVSSEKFSSLCDSEEDLRRRGSASAWQPAVHIAIQPLLSDFPQSSAWGEQLVVDDQLLFASDEKGCETRAAVAFGTVASLIALGGSYRGLVSCCVGQPWIIEQLLPIVPNPAGSQLRQLKKSHCSFPAALAGFCPHLVGADAAKAVLLLHAVLSLGGAMTAPRRRWHLVVAGEAGSGRSSLLSAYRALISRCAPERMAVAGAAVASAGGCRSLAPRSHQLLPCKGRSAGSIVAGLLPVATPSSASGLAHFLFVDDLDSSASQLLPAVDAIMSPWPLLQLPQSGSTTVAAQFADMSRVVVIAACSVGLQHRPGEWPVFELPVVLSRRLAQNHDAQISRSLVRHTASLARSSCTRSCSRSSYSQQQIPLASDFDWDFHRSFSFVSEDERPSFDQIVAEVQQAAANISASFVTSLIEAEKEMVPHAHLAAWLRRLSLSERTDVFCGLVAARAAFEVEAPAIWMVEEVANLVRLQAESTTSAADDEAAAFGGPLTTADDSKRRRGGGPSQKDTCRAFLRKLLALQNGRPPGAPCLVAEAKALFAASQGPGRSTMMVFDEALQKLSADGMILHVNGGIRCIG
jgi:hypothetical protein